MHELTKSQFMDYLVCPAYCWMKVNQPDKFAKISSELGVDSQDFTEQAKQFGKEIDQKAQLLFEDGHKIETDQSSQSIEDTEEAIKSGHQILYQAGFGNSSFLIRADIVKRLSEDSDQWILYEVKSSTKVKKEHIIDLAFQKIICQKVDIQIADTRVILLNKDYRLGQVAVEDTLDTFFIRDENDDQLGVSVNGQVQELIDGTSKYLDVPIETKIDQAKATLDSAKKPDCFCRFKPKSQHSPIFKHFNPNVPDYSIYNLSRVTQKKIAILLENGINDVETLSQSNVEPYKFSPVQKKQVELYPDKTEINKIAIAAELESLQFPLYFLDYETISTPVPVFKNSGPYWHLPFLYSIHVDSNQSLEVRIETFRLSARRSQSKEIRESSCKPN